MSKRLSGVMAIIIAVGLILGGCDALRSKVLHEKGVKLYQQGKYKQALDYFEQALAIDKKAYGEQHPEVAIDLNNIGTAWDSLGEHHRAIGYYEQARQYGRRLMGKNIPR